MSQLQEPLGARRAVNDSPGESMDIEIHLESDTGKARRGRGHKLGRSAVASVLTGAVAAATLFGFALTARDGGEDLDSPYASKDLAIPAAAVNSAHLGFADRSESVSRNAVRSGLANAVADDNQREREDLIEDTVTQAYEGQASTSADEREQLMSQDMELVKAQEDKLQKEAEEARLKMEEAKRLAAEAAEAGAEAGHSAEFNSMSADDVATLTSQGGAKPVTSNYRVGASYGATGSWSRYHTGQDFPAPTGTPIYAAASGIVLSPTAGSWAGTNVVIQHSNGGATLYAHMSRRVVSPGETVEAGQLIGYVGNTGRSFGSHLHFEYYPAGTTPGDVYSAANPMAFLRSLGVTY